MLKRIIALIFSVLLFAGYPFKNTEYKIPVTVEGSIFSGNAGDTVKTEMKFDSKWITTASNKMYNGMLAQFSAILCADSYFRAKDVAKGTQNRVLIDGEEDNYSQTALLEKLGYTDVKFIETYKQKQYSADTNDSATFIAAYKKIDNSYDSYIFVMRGSFSIGERLSIFDVGSESDNYKALTGEHTEWTDKAYFKGLNVSVNRAKEFIDDYMSTHDDPACADTVLVTGHSRGAAIANVIGAQLEKNDSIRSYTYTFNSMPVTKDAGARSYRTVYNIFDINDYYVNPLPFGNEQYFRFGKDIGMDISKSSSVKKLIADLKGRDDYVSFSASGKAEYDKLFGEYFPDRKATYEMKNHTEIFDSREAASERTEELKTIISGLGISDFCTVSEITEAEGKYTVDVGYCGGALLFSLAQIQAYGSVAYDGVISLFKGDETAFRLAEIMNDSLDVLNGGHLLLNGYVLSGNRFKTR